MVWRQNSYSQSKQAGSSHTNEETPPWAEDGYWESLLAEGETTRYEKSPHAPLPPMEEPHPTYEAALAVEAEPDPLAGLSPEERDWQLVEKGFADNQIYDLVVTAFNRGGLLVRLNSLTGFVPSSHLIGLTYTNDNRQLSLGVRVGHSIRVRIIELDRARNRLILSERIAQEDERPPDVLSQLRPNDCCAGTVSNLCHFGAFVDLGGGVEGLIHISELSWGRVGHPSEVLQLGERVSVFVMDVDKDQHRVGLSLKRMTPDPWTSVEEHYHIGQLVQGVVTNVVSFGAFVRLEEGLEGLIHISELAEGSFLHPRNVVQENTNVTARVISIDPASRRLALSLRRLQTRT